jgi:SAM-dependent methyltransferase
VIARHKPWSESCEQNKAPILALLRQVLRPDARVLEIGSGTGQHAVHFGAQMPGLHWQPSERAENLPGICAWLAEAGLSNVEAPLELDVLGQWPDLRVQAVFSANTAHIMSWAAVEAMFRGVAGVLAADDGGGRFCLYGPFSYGGRHTSPSNAQFDRMLRARDSLSGVRDVDDLNRLARTNGLEPDGDYEMPVNNRILVWRHRPSPSED